MDNQPDQATPTPIQEQPVPVPPVQTPTTPAPVMQTPPPPPLEQASTQPSMPASDAPAKERGFPKLLLLGIVIIVLILAIGTGGYYVLNQKLLTPTPAPAQQTSTQIQEPTATPTPEPIVAKTFTSPKLANVSFSGFTLIHQSDWIEKSVRDDTVGTASLTLNKGDYSLSISQGPFDGGVCVYTDAEFAANQGPTSDKRNKPATDIIASFGSLRRDLEVDSLKNNSFAFCQKNDQDASYGTLTKIGAISYKTATATFDPLMLTEMDEIIKSVKVL